jgi:hypothetical protein
MKTQWHPVFVHAMSLLLEDFYVVEPEVPTGDLPRRADLMLLRRAATDPPFTGIWANLLDWNLFEFKSPLDHAESLDLDFLMHVGTGIFCRFNEQRRDSGEQPIRHRQFALWYVVPRLPEPFWEHTRERCFWEAEAGGVWRGRAWNYPVYLLDYSMLDTTTVDALPLGILRRERGGFDATSQVLRERIDLFRRYRELLQRFRPTIWEELKTMKIDPSIVDWQEVGRATANILEDILPYLPVDQLLKGIPEEKVIQTLGEEKVIETLGPEHLLQKLLAGKTPEQIQEMIRKAQGEAN